MNMFSKVTVFYKKIITGIAFLPSLIALSMGLLAIGLVSVQEIPTARDLLSTLNFIQVNDTSTARVILGSILTGIISLTAFGFSMVMVVVNQSASNYSPKVVEGFIGQTANQVILGVYIGTILFVTVSLSQISDIDNAQVQHFNVFASIILLAVCMGVFILFIQNISNSVRINNVAERIFIKTRRAIKNETYDVGEYPKGKEWHPYTAETGGYFQSISSSRLLSVLREEKLMLKVVPYYGTYLHPQQHLFCLNKKITDEKLLNEIRGMFNMYSGENIDENYFYGFRQLREVAVKALSPGINDPGIAIICLDYLSELLALYLDQQKKLCLNGNEKGVGIFFIRHEFSEMLNLTISPIAAYGKRDYLVLAQVLRLLYNISLYDEDKQEQSLLSEFGTAVLQTADQNIDATFERKHIDQVVRQLTQASYLRMDEIGC